MYVLAAMLLQLTECVCVGVGVRVCSGVRFDFVFTPDWSQKCREISRCGWLNLEPWTTRVTESHSEPNLCNDQRPFPCFLE